MADNTDPDSSRIKAPPAPELIATAYARELGDAAILYEGMSLADLAHVIMLVETGVIPREAGGELLAALLTLHPAPPLDFALDPARGDLYSNREAYLRMLTPAAGWLSAGRARREATTIGYRLAVRGRLLDLAAALNSHLDRLIWEAPLKNQQEYLILRFGPDVGLGNIQPRDVLGVEALRAGLRFETLRPLIEKLESDALR